MQRFRPYLRLMRKTLFKSIVIMVNKKLNFVLGIGLALAHSSCIVINTSTPHSDDEVVIEQTINLSSFDAIDISASEVVFKVGEENKEFVKNFDKSVVDLEMEKIYSNVSDLR